MNKIYIGDQEINTGSGGGGGSEFNPSDYVDASTWNEHEKVIASALVNLKGLEAQIEAFDEDIQAQETALLAEVHVVEQTKADVSVVYTKTDIDKSDKVVAAALASLNERVTTLETSSGGSGGSGDSFDPEYLEVELADVSARVDALEQVDYVVTNDISAFVKENDISTFVTQTALDASFIELDASIIALDASVKELASSSGGGVSSDPTFIRKGDSIISYFSEPYVNNAGTNNIILNGKYSYNTSVNYSGDGNIVAAMTSSITSGNANRNLLIGGSFNINKPSTNSIYCGNSIGLNDNAYISNSIFSGQYITIRNSVANSFISLYGNNFVNLYGVLYGCGITGYYWNNTPVPQNTKTLYGCHVEGYCNYIDNTTNDLNGVHIEGGTNVAKNNYEHASGFKNNSVRNSSTFGDSGNTLMSVGNGRNVYQTSRLADTHYHNAFEVRQSGDIYVADVSASGEYYEKPMINLQQKLYTLDASVSEIYSMIPIITYDPSTKILNIITE